MKITEIIPQITINIFRACFFLKEYLGHVRHIFINIRRILIIFMQLYIQ